MWVIAWLCMVGLLIGALVIGLVWNTKWFAPWREGDTAAATARPAKVPRPLKPRTPDDCPACRGRLSHDGTGEAEKAAVGCVITPYAQVKSTRGRKKQQPTSGYACPNPGCVYFGVTDEAIHALVHCGSHGQHECISDLKCQACGRKVSVRYGTRCIG
jgi:hypothetical protein